MWFESVAMTPARWAVYDAMERYDEGLGPRGYRCVLQIGDNDPRLTSSDVGWMTDGIEQPALAEMREGRVKLTELGRRVYDAANAGDWITVIRLTTDPQFNLSPN